MTRRAQVSWTICVLFAGLGVNAASPAHAQSRIGRVTGALGATSPGLDDAVLGGDVLTTGGDQALMVYLDAYRGVLCLAPDSRATVTDAYTIRVDQGLVRLYYDALQPGQTITLSTANGDMTLSGSVVWVEHDAEGNRTTFATEDTAATAGGVALEPGQYVVLQPGEPGKARSFRRSQVKNWERRLSLNALMVSRSTDRTDERVASKMLLMALPELMPTIPGETALRVEQQLASASAGTEQAVIDLPVIAPKPGAAQLLQPQGQPTIVPAGTLADEDPGLAISPTLSAGNGLAVKRARSATVKMQRKPRLYRPIGTARGHRPGVKRNH